MFRRLRKMNSLQRNTASFRRCPSLRRFVKRSQLREAIRSGHFCALKRSTRSRRFRAVSEQRTRNEGQRPREKWPLVPFFARPKPKIPLHVVPRSLFAPKPHGNVCFAGQLKSNNSEQTAINTFSHRKTRSGPLLCEGAFAECTRESTSEITDFF